MRDVLCIYYSRTGNTKKVMKAIASEMDAELVELTDGIERSGLRGWLRSGLMPLKRIARRPLPLKRNESWKITGWSLSARRYGPDGAAALSAAF